MSSNSWVRFIRVIGIFVSLVAISFLFHSVFQSRLIDAYHHGLAVVPALACQSGQILSSDIVTPYGFLPPLLHSSIFSFFGESLHNLLVFASAVESVLWAMTAMVVGACTTFWLVPLYALILFMSAPFVYHPLLPWNTAYSMALIVLGLLLLHDRCTFRYRPLVVAFLWGLGILMRPTFVFVLAPVVVVAMNPLMRSRLSRYDFLQFILGLSGAMILPTLHPCAPSVGEGLKDLFVMGQRFNAVYGMLGRDGIFLSSLWKNFNAQFVMAAVFFAFALVCLFWSKLQRFSVQRRLMAVGMVFVAAVFGVKQTNFEIYPPYLEMGSLDLALIVIGLLCGLRLMLKPSDKNRIFEMSLGGIAVGSIWVLYPVPSIIHLGWALPVVYVPMFIVFFRALRSLKGSLKVEIYGLLMLLLFPTICSIDSTLKAAAWKLQVVQSPVTECGPFLRGMIELDSRAHDYNQICREVRQMGGAVDRLLGYDSILSFLAVRPLPLYFVEWPEIWPDSRIQIDTYKLKEQVLLLSGHQYQDLPKWLSDDRVQLVYDGKFIQHALVRINR